MRKVLYSADYGGGWVSWFSGTRRQKKFMLEYPPFIEFLEQGNKFTVGKIGTNNFQPADLCLRFKEDWDNTFPESKGDYPHFGGLRDLAIFNVPDDVLVEIEEYDGKESVRIRYQSEDWL